MLSGLGKKDRRRRPRDSRPIRGWHMVNPLGVPVEVTARLVVKPKHTVFVPLHLCLSALAKGLVFADKAKKRR